MGDIGSSKKVSTTNTTNNQQVALQGRGQVGISGSQISGDVHVENSDPEVVLAALTEVGRSSNNSSIVALSALDANKEVSSRALNTVDNSLALAAGVSNASHQTVISTLAALRDYQDRSLATVDRSVAAAQETALLATPQSPAAYAEIMAGQGSSERKQIFFAVAVIVAIGAVAVKLRNN